METDCQHMRQIVDTYKPFNNSKAPNDLLHRGIKFCIKLVALQYLKSFCLLFALYTVYIVYVLSIELRYAFKTKD